MQTESEELWPYGHSQPCIETEFRELQSKRQGYLLLTPPHLGESCTLWVICLD